MAKTIIQKMIMSITIFTIIISLITHINLQTFAAENQVNDSFYVIDDEGNVHLVETTPEDLIELKKKKQSYSVVVKMGDETEVIGEYSSLQKAQKVYKETVNFLDNVSYYIEGDDSTNGVEVEINNGKIMPFGKIEVPFYLTITSKIKLTTVI